MSLAERLSAMEDYDSLRELSPAGGRRRKLSFSPAPAAWLPPEETPEPIGAFEVPATKRIGKTVLCKVNRWSRIANQASGIQLKSYPLLCTVFWEPELYLALPQLNRVCCCPSSLKLLLLTGIVLIEENVYRDLCTPKEIERNVTVCYDQELR
jgi:hypothetical protein